MLVGMSGGVDSSVALLLLKNQGYDVHGVTLVMFENEDIGLDKGEKACGSSVELFDAVRLAEKMGCPHHIVDDKEGFRRRVLEYFARSYEGGETPNPCAVCNKTVKFPGLFACADRLQIDKVATGHYAKVSFDPAGGKYKLLRAADDKKDQSYFLYKLGQAELSRLIFPLGEITKEKVRQLAKSAGLETAEKKDSQDICFVKNKSYVDFLTSIMGAEMEKGDFLNLEGEVIGWHQGFISYTIGQRKGLGATFGKPMYVVGKNHEDKSVVLGQNSDLFSKIMIVSETSYVSGEKLEDELLVEVKSRNTAKPAKARIFNISDEEIRIEFEEEQRALTPGQSAVIYLKNEVLGGGKISKVL